MITFDKNWCSGELKNSYGILIQFVGLSERDGWGTGTEHMKMTSWIKNDEPFTINSNFLPSGLSIWFIE